MSDVDKIFDILKSDFKLGMQLVESQNIDINLINDKVYEMFREHAFNMYYVDIEVDNMPGTCINWFGGFFNLETMTFYEIYFLNLDDYLKHTTKSIIELLINYFK